MKYLIIVRRREWPDALGRRGEVCPPVTFCMTATLFSTTHARSKTWTMLFEKLTWAMDVLIDCDGDRRRALRRLATRYGRRCESATLKLDD